MAKFHVEYAKADQYREEAVEALTLMVGLRADTAEIIVDLILKAAVSYSVTAAAGSLEIR